MPATPVRAVLIGAAGQLGFDLGRTFDLPGELIRLTRAELDLTNDAAIERTVRSLRPTHVLNAAAYNLVDRAEDEPELAFAVNGRAVGSLAAACRALDATLVHFSTDYVFDGRQTTPYREDDSPNPLSVYAASKLDGERRALAGCARAFVVRVCGLFGVGRSQAAGRTNFVETMLRLAREGRAIRVVRDQVLSPSYTRDIAPKVWRVLTRGAPGLYHLTNAGQTSFFDFARAIFHASGLTPDLTAVTAAEFGARARRPAYSVLARDRLGALGEDDLRAWPEALAAYLQERAALSAPARPGS